MFKLAGKWTMEGFRSTWYRNQKRRSGIMLEDEEDV